MAKATIRDEIWTYVLTKTVRAESVVRPTGVAEHVGCSERVARDVLNIISGAGFIDRSTKSDGTVRYSAEGDI